jgi:DNA-binding transcriptional ArsR family regulator
MEMPARTLAPEIATVSDPRIASLLLHPLRSRLLALARDPMSSSDLARRVGLPRQRVNYHVRALEAAGFLKPAGRQRKRNMIEQRYVATARAFVLSPFVLGPVGADWREISDPASADYLLALTEQVRADLVRVLEEAGAAGHEASTLSLKAQFRLESPVQRAEFTRAVREAIVAVIARHTRPNRLENGRPGRGQPFRLVLACYPAPPELGAEEPKRPGR